MGSSASARAWLVLQGAPVRQSLRRPLHTPTPELLGASPRAMRGQLRWGRACPPNRREEQSVRLGQDSSEAPVEGASLPPEVRAAGGQAGFTMYSLNDGHLIYRSLFFFFNTLQIDHCESFPIAIFLTEISLDRMSLTPTWSRVGAPWGLRVTHVAVQFGSRWSTWRWFLSPRG